MMKSRLVTGRLFFQKLGRGISSVWRISLNWVRRSDDWLILAVGLILALVLRLLLRGYVSGDTLTGFIPWYEYIESQGGFPALAHDFSGYPPLYLYMLVISYSVNQWLNVSSLLAIKLIPILFDFFGAFWFYKIVHLKFPGKTIAKLAALAYLFLPTVFINSSMWGQNDGVFIAFLLAMTYYLLKRRNVPAMLFFGLAFSIKLQAIFIAPVLAVLVLLGQLPFFTLFIVPLVYFVTLIPSWAFGRSIWDLLTLYVGQVNSFEQLTLNAPTFYAFIDQSVFYLFKTVGIVLAIAILMMGIWGVYKLRPRIHPELILHLMASTSLLAVYILPMMHERYFIVAEVFCLLLAFYRPRLAGLVIGLQILALSTTSSYFYGTTFLTVPTASLMMLVLLVWLLYDLASLLKLKVIEQPA
jgi:Gpi18-like mannosyltransferase